jgi:Flp pilus assembly protein TadD
MKARKASPDDPVIAQILAKLSYQRKQYCYALQLLQESAKKAPLNAQSLYYLGMSHRQAQGKHALQQALAAGLTEPLSTDAKRVLAERRED